MVLLCNLMSRRAAVSFDIASLIGTAHTKARGGTKRIPTIWPIDDWPQIKIAPPRGISKTAHTGVPLP